MESLKGRLITVATIWIGIGLVAAGLALAAIFKHHVTEQFHEELFVHLDELQRLAQFMPDGTAQLQRDLSDPRYEVSLSGYYWEIQRAGKSLSRSLSLHERTLPSPPDAPIDTNVHTHRIAGPTGPLLIAERVVPRQPYSPQIRFIIGMDEKHLNVVLARFNATLVRALSIFGISMVIAAALLIAFAMRPFQTLRTSLSRVRSGHDKLLHGRFPGEVVPLVDDLNTLLGSTSELLQRARTQAGNLAHGLKTPLAILTDEAYQLAGKGQEETSSTILAECKKMQTHIDYQVTRARAVAMRSSPGIVADVGSAATDVAAALGRLYSDGIVSISVKIADGVKVACDPQDLNEMLGNLVDNACKHARNSVKISLAGNEKDKLVSIVIDDDGKGLPVEARRVVFNVGERWDSRAPGTGLGLAIVKDLAELYGGTVELGTSAEGGLSVMLRLPRAVL